MLNEEVKKILENNLGLSYNQICGLDIKEEISLVGAKTGTPPRFIHDSRKIGRGSPLLAQGKFTTMEEINKKIDALHR